MEITELKNAMPGTKSSLNEQSKIEATQEIINELEDMTIEIIGSEEQKEEIVKRSEQSLRDL